MLHLVSDDDDDDDAPAKVSTNVAAIAAQLAVLAARGEVVGLVAVVEYRSGRTDSTIALDDGHPKRLLGQIVLAQRDVIAEVDSLVAG